MSEPRTILENARTVAVVGISRDPSKPSGGVPAALQERGFRIIPVNPHAGELLGERSVPSLGEVKESVDVVEVFRPAEEAPDIARQAIEIGAKALWLQLGIRSPKAREIAERAGLDYVEDHCMAVEARRHDIKKGSKD